MPRPESGESQGDWMKRCVPEVKDEGATQEQAVGKCLGMYRYYTGKESVIGKIDMYLNEATVVGEVGKDIATSDNCPEGQRWCPRCHACIDIREKPGTGNPPPCPHGKEGMFSWEE